MKIDINQIPVEGLTIKEGFSAGQLELETDTVKFRGQIKAEAQISRITNAVTVGLVLNASMLVICSRCLDEFNTDVKRSLRISYPADQSEPVIDLDPEIREEIILDYPIKPLCKPDCKGLCVKCGDNLNEGICKCRNL